METQRCQLVIATSYYAAPQTRSLHCLADYSLGASRALPLQVGSIVRMIHT